MAITPMMVSVPSNEYGLTLLGNAFNYRLEGSGAEFGPTWEKPSDVAGLFWDCETGSVAFTRNGATVGLAFHNVSGSFYPAVGLNTPTAVVAINFGQRPFAFGKFHVTQTQDFVLILYQT